MQFSSRVLVVVALCLTGSGQMLKSATANPEPTQVAKDAPPSGVVVESVTPGSPAEKAGLRVGDILQWCGARPLRSAFDFLAARENASGSAITLKGLRANQPFTVHLPIELMGIPSLDKEWDIRFRPQWPLAVQALYDAGQAKFAGGHVEEGVVSWRSAIEVLEKGGESTGAAWLCWRIGEMYRTRSDWKQVQQWQEHAWKNVKSEGNDVAQTSALRGLGNALVSQGDLVNALAQYEQARKLDADNRNVFWEAQDVSCEGSIAFTRHDWKKARELNEQALTLCRTQTAASWQSAFALEGLGSIASAQGNYPQAQKDYEAALAMIPKHWRDSLVAAGIFNDIALVAFNQNRLPQGMEYLRQALAIYRREDLAPEDQLVILSNMGRGAVMQGDVTHARAYLEEALSLARKYKPDSAALSAVLIGLSGVESAAGNLPQAEKDAREALNIRLKIISFPEDEAECYTQLGNIAAQQGNSDNTRKYANMALDTLARLKSDSIGMVNPLVLLGILAQQAGDIPQARNYLKRALAICERLNPHLASKSTILTILSLIGMEESATGKEQKHGQETKTPLQKTVAGPLQEILDLVAKSIAAAERGDLTQARKYAQQEFDLQQKIAPDDPNMIVSYALLGYVELRHEEFKTAQSHFQQMLDLTQKFASGSLEEANARAFLGHVLLAQHDYGGALKQFDSAITIVEAQRQRIANPDNRALLLEQHSVPFLGMMQAQIALNQKVQAFETLERARARSLVDLISERKPSSSTPPLPDAPLELVEKQQQINHQRSELSRKLLAAAANSSQPEADSLREQINALDVQQRDLETTIRQTSSHYAGLQYPKPLSFEEAQQTLDDGTLLLAYALGEKQSYLFAMTKTRLEVMPLAAGEEALARDIKNLNGALQAQGSYQVLARRLYQQLVAPARKYIDDSRRLLLCPDGVLNTLPFAALVTSAPDKPLQHLVEVRPLHVITSLSLYHELRLTPVSRTGKILALADPDYGKDSVAPTPRSASFAFRTLGFASDRAPASGKTASFGETKATSGGTGRAKTAFAGKGHGLYLEPLTETRKQIATLQKLYGARVEAHVGKQATTAAIRQAGPELAILHLACHGFLDNGDPLSSALALSSGGAHADMLFASDILRLHLPTDLVILSACETGLGKQTQFEGVVGLTRAFQYAGAHTVGVSLWKVNVDSTTELMNRFYTEYKAGVSKDVALQRAQIAILHDPLHRWHDPYFWAAFQMVGDWK